MIKYPHSLLPTLTPLFASDSLTLAQDSRILFYQLLHVSEHPAVLESAYAFIKQQLQAVKQYPDADFSLAYHPDALDKDSFHAYSGQLNPQGVQDCLQLISPIVFTELGWLNTIVQANTNQTPLAMAMFSVMLNLNQGVQAGAFIKAELLSAGIALPELHTWAFAQQSAIPDSLFDFGALQLALGQFSSEFFPEILGFNYAYCRAMGILEQLNLSRQDNHNFSQFLNARQQRLQAELPKLLNIIQEYLKLFEGQQVELWLRIQTGYCLYRQQNERCYQQLKEQLDCSLSPKQLLIRLLQRITPQAIGHHAKIKLAGQSLDTWFAASLFDSEGFLEALKQSPYIDQQNPADSPLLKLFEFKGPMFGVLNPTEKNTLKAWVCAVQTDLPFKVYSPNADTDCEISASLKTEGLPDEQISRREKAINFSKLNQRAWFHTLVNIEHFPAALRVAKQKVHKVLTLTRLLRRLPFKRYTHPAFNTYISDVYQHEVKTYQPLLAPPGLSKQTYIWGIEQLAPAILTDGCWLQNINQLQYHPTHAIGATLFKIYADELGSGIMAQNHPAIYQQLLDSTGVNLPPIHTKEFSQHAGFIASAFDIPCYLMAISKFPCAFLPELLGLNMAIELSGLGKGYLRLAQALTFYGLDASIVNVHISIDNVATGHAALAKQAIQSYLDEILACSGEQVMQQHWRRIYTGYCSLASVSRGFKVALVSHVLLKRLAMPFKRHFKTNLTAFS
ncbi:MAG: iron-containing redox enzyme family protein [Methylococcales bacterium]